MKILSYLASAFRSLRKFLFGKIEAAIMKELALYEKVGVDSSTAMAGSTTDNKVEITKGKIAEEVTLLNRKVCKLTGQSDGSEWPFQEKFEEAKEEPGDFPPITV